MKTKVAVELRNVGDVTEIEFRGPGTLKITQGDRETLKIHAPAYVMEHIRADVTDGRLQLGYVSPQVASLRVYSEVISFDLKVKDLKQLTINGSGKVIAPDLDVDRLDVVLSGSAKVYLQHLTSDHLTSTISGSGHISVAGDVESQLITINGSGKYPSEHLVSDFAQVTINGSGAADVSCSDELNVLINGSGKVTYAGYPEVAKRIQGSGKVSRRRRDKRHQPLGEEHG